MPALLDRSSLSARSLRHLQRLRVMHDVVGHEGLDEPVGMIVARMAAQRQPLAGGLGGSLQQLGLELLGQELVVLTLVDRTQRTYVVDKVLPKVPWDALRYLAPTAAEQLTLQTSTSYTATAPRFLVIAHPTP